MKDLIILSDKPITYESCRDIIKSAFKNMNILGDVNDYLYLGKKDHRFEVWFSPDDVLDDPMCMMEDTVDRCPNKKAYLTNVSYTHVTIAKKIVSLLKDLYGNMWVQSDEEDDWFGTAEDFIKLY